jgi:effector-binding domain-containing protein
MKIPEFRLPYMAILAGLASDLPPDVRTSAMTHLSWDEFGARVLERRNSRKPGRAAGLSPWWIKALVHKVLGRVKMFRFRRLALAALIPAAALSFGLSATLAQTPSPAPAASASPSPAPSASPAPAASASPAPVATPSPAASASPSPATSSPATSPSPAASASPSPAAPPPAAAANPAPVQTADPFGQEATLEPKKVVMVKGTANWDSAFDTLIDAFKALNTLLDKQGIKQAGNSMIVYTSTDDTGFTFLAEIPVEQDPKNLPKDMSVGKSPEGKALKFVHRGSYDNMDNTYEAITNHLDDKKLEAKDTFIEEYLTDPLKTAEDKLVINVFVPLK